MAERVAIEQVSSDGRPPSVVEPGPEWREGEWLRWVERRRDWIAERLDRHGALLFRGFDVGDAAALEAFCAAAGYPLMDYLRGVTSRRVVQGRVHNTTDAPPGAILPLHNEMAYTSVYPEAIAFCCEIAPTRRGETPVADMGRVLDRLPERLVRQFEERGLRYVQRVPSVESGVRGRTWQQMFATVERERVEEVCREQGIECRWEDHGWLRLTNERPAVLTHPRSGGRIWFNHAHTFHPSFSAELFHDRRPLLGTALRLFETLRGVLPDRPRFRRVDCRYGDGSPIPRATIRRVRRAIWDETRIFRWQSGDLLLLDNLRVAHGRAPFRGRRRILAALIERLDAPDAGRARSAGG